MGPAWALPRTGHPLNERKMPYDDGETIFSGRTHSSNCSALSSPISTAASFRVFPSLYAVLATFAALS